VEKQELTTALPVHPVTVPVAGLGFQYVALVDPATAKEAVAHHGLAKQKNDAYQDD
jgi:hypothetical protein